MGGGGGKGGWDKMEKVSQREGERECQLFFNE